MAVANTKRDMPADIATKLEFELDRIYSLIHWHQYLNRSKDRS